MTLNKSRILEAISALQSGDRRRAASLIKLELQQGEPTGERWASVSKLALKIGELDMAVDASRRSAFSEPIRLDRLLGHCGLLAQLGRATEALALISKLPAGTQGHAAVLHFRGTIASEKGDFEAAEEFIRCALAADGSSPQSWFALAMLKTFEERDPDFEKLANLEANIGRADGMTQARYYYGIGKALVDMCEVERGFEYYRKGAEMRQLGESYDYAKQEHVVAGLIRDFTSDGISRLAPSQFSEQRSLFVNGLPRSGTTLVESILVNHSRVSDGAEINLVQPSLIPTGDRSYAGALAYQANSGGADPWGEIAHDYHEMVQMRFGQSDLIVDKTVSQSLVMGLLLHSMPTARVVWLRRRPDDIALSAYRAFFTSPVPWSWSFEDIAHRIAMEDKLFQHWSDIFPDRILAVHYEDLVGDPDIWISKIIDHFGLEFETGLQDFHRQSRSVRTASVKQVRSAISTGAIGKSERFAAQMAPFHEAYERFASKAS